ncbi:hypothetical protein EVAR_10410_1 [Eumeta japonica]|uniref:Uncharacterized protein n=1 Tax=Eumeta variegata TaxID=151549 RepID=A0A4C1UCL1_EUMVA|nr:hypothetical protein EVAR_10410_1 [Eumeta japonica]
MSIVEIPEAVNEKLKANDIDKIPDNNYEFKSNAKNEVLNDDTVKDDNTVENGDVEKEHSNTVSDFNICNGKVNADLEQEVGKVIADTQEINYSSTDHEKLGNNKENGKETETVDSGVPNNNEICVAKEIEDSNCNSHTSKSSESTTLKTTDNLFNGTEIPFSDEALSKKLNEDKVCDELSRENETIAIPQVEERNLNTSLEQTVVEKTEIDLGKTESDKIESPTYNIENVGIVEQTRLDVDNSIATESTLTKIKTEHEIQIDEQDMEMSFVKDNCNKTVEHSIEIKKEAHLLDIKSESNNEYSSFGSSGLEDSKSIVKSISLKTESEDAEAESQVGQLLSEKKIVNY